MKNNNYFPMPNEIFCLGLNSGEIAVYSYLMSCENRETYQCYPSYNTIGNALKMSKKTVMKYVKSLEDKCLITTEHTTVTEGGTKTGKGRRSFYLPESTANILAERKCNAKTEWMFTDPSNPNLPVPPSKAYRKMKELLTKANLPNI